MLPARIAPAGYAATITSLSDEPRVVEVGGTTDEVAWVLVSDTREGARPVAGVVRYAVTELSL